MNIDWNLIIISFITLTQILCCIAGFWWFYKYESGNGVRFSILAVFATWAWCQTGWFVWRLLHYHTSPVSPEYLMRVSALNGPLAVASVGAAFYFAKLIWRARRHG